MACSTIKTGVNSTVINVSFTLTTRKSSATNAGVPSNFIMTCSTIKTRVNSTVINVSFTCYPRISWHTCTIVPIFFIMASSTMCAGIWWAAIFNRTSAWWKRKILINAACSSLVFTQMCVQVYEINQSTTFVWLLWQEINMKIGFDLPFLYTICVADEKWTVPLELKEIIPQVLVSSKFNMYPMHCWSVAHLQSKVFSTLAAICCKLWTAVVFHSQRRQVIKRHALRSTEWNFWPWLKLPNCQQCLLCRHSQNCILKGFDRAYLVALPSVMREKLRPRESKCDGVPCVVCSESILIVFEDTHCFCEVQNQQLSWPQFHGGYCFSWARVPSTTQVNSQKTRQGSFLLCWEVSGDTLLASSQRSIFFLLNCTLGLAAVCWCVEPVWRKHSQPVLPYWCWRSIEIPRRETGGKQRSLHWQRASKRGSYANENCR